MWKRLEIGIFLDLAFLFLSFSYLYLEVAKWRLWLCLKISILEAYQQKIKLYGSRLFSWLLVDGNYSTWGAWSSCSQSCGNGTQIRIRNCTNPPPQFGGRDCVGPRNETQDCYAGPCPGWLLCYESHEPFPTTWVAKLYWRDYDIKALRGLNHTGVKHFLVLPWFSFLSRALKTRGIS